MSYWSGSSLGGWGCGCGCEGADENGKCPPGPPGPAGPAGPKGDPGTSGGSGSCCPPTKLTMYFGIPSTVNHRYDSTYAGQMFSRFDHVVFGPGMASPAHPNYVSNMQVFTTMRRLNPQIKIYGTVEIQGLSPAPAPTMEQIKQGVDEYAVAGADGMFLRYSGYDRGTTRERQNEVVDYVHGKNMIVMVASRNADDTLGNAVVDPGNPAGTPTHIRAGDIFLIESWVVDTEEYAATDGYAGMPSSRQRADRAVAYRKDLRIKVFGMSEADYNLLTEEQICTYEQVSDGMGAIWAMDAYGLGDADYAQKCNMTRQARCLKCLPYPISDEPYFMDIGVTEVERPDIAITVHIDTTGKVYWVKNLGAGCGG